jgi:hypothetical protein
MDGKIKWSMGEMLEKEREPMGYAPDDILVTVLHPWGDITTTLALWMECGPGPRSFVRANNPRVKATGQALPQDAIPLEYQNTRESRDLIRRGLLSNPWPDRAWPYPPEE